MNTSELASNPFALMMDPQAVVAALERSTRLAQLKRTICRPLDKTITVATSDADEADSSLEAPVFDPQEDAR